MAISTIDGYIGAAKQKIPWYKTATRTTVALGYFSLFDIAGSPGGGTLAGSSTANGVVPTDATSGCPTINFSSGTGYLTNVEISNTVISRIHLYDMLFKAGNYAYNSGTTNLSSQPAISSRCPDYTGGSTFGNGCEIWIEIVAAMTSATAWQVQVTYTNSAGGTGKTSVALPATAAANLTVGRMYQLGLAAGDSGVQKIESVIVTTGGAAAGSFNVLILRPLYFNRITVANAGVISDILGTGMPIVYSDSALVMVVNADSTSSGLPNGLIEISSG